MWVLDKTATSMGARLLRRWINEPLVDTDKINLRLNGVAELKSNEMLRGDVKENLKRVYDIERLIGKISYGNANGRDLISLKNSLNQLPKIKENLKNAKSDMLINLHEKLDTLNDIYELIDKWIVEEPPVTIKEGGVIKTGISEELDELKLISTQGKNWIVQIEAKERENTGIKNLKVGYNKVFGYYIEVTKSYLACVPDRFIRKQTLANCERYITEELKEFENKVMGAEEKIVVLEYDLFLELRDKISKQIERIQNASNIVSTLDVICSFSRSCI